LPASVVHALPLTLIEAPVLAHVALVPKRVAIWPVVQDGVAPTVHAQSQAPAPT
jgi:hypothetical protein